MKKIPLINKIVVLLLLIIVINTILLITNEENIEKVSVIVLDKQELVDNTYSKHNVSFVTRPYFLVKSKYGYGKMEVDYTTYRTTKKYDAIVFSLSINSINNIFNVNLEDIYHKRAKICLIILFVSFVSLLLICFIGLINDI